MEDYKDLAPQVYYLQVVPTNTEITVLDLTLAFVMGVLMLSFLCIVLEKYLEEELRNNNFNQPKKKP